MTGAPAVIDRELGRLEGLWSDGLSDSYRSYLDAVHDHAADKQQQLPAMRVPVDGLVERDVDPPREVVVLVARVAWREPLQQRVEVLEQQWLVFVDRQSQRRVQRLQMDAAGGQPAFPDLVADALAEVDELGRLRAFEVQTAGDHLMSPGAL